MNTAAAYKWRITNAKYIYITDEIKQGPFIYDKETETRTYLPTATETSLTEVDEVLVKRNVSSFSESEYADSFNKMKGLLSSDEDGQYLQLLDYTAYMDDLQSCIDGATDVTCNPIDVMFEAETETYDTGDDARVTIESIVDEVSADGGKTRTFNLLFGIPRGVKGEQGDAGKSAYEIAVEAGYTGTSAEWLASLKGEDGEDGKNGENGAAGKSAYQSWLDQGHTGSEGDFLYSLKGEQGNAGIETIEEFEDKTKYNLIGWDGETNEKLSYENQAYLETFQNDNGTKTLGLMFDSGKTTYDRNYLLFVTCVKHTIKETEPLSEETEQLFDTFFYRNKQNESAYNYYLDNDKYIFKSADNQKLLEISSKNEPTVYAILKSIDNDIATKYSYLTDDKEINYIDYDNIIIDKAGSTYLTITIDKLSVEVTESTTYNPVKVYSSGSTEISAVTNTFIVDTDKSIKVVLTSDEKYVTGFEAGEAYAKLYSYYGDEDEDTKVEVDKHTVSIVSQYNTKIKSDYLFITGATHCDSTIQATVNDISNVYLGCPIGTMVMWPSDVVPDGWALCNGTGIPVVTASTTDINTFTLNYTIATISFSKDYKIATNSGYAQYANLLGKVLCNCNFGFHYSDSTYLVDYVYLPNLQQRFPLGASAGTINDGYTSGGDHNTPSTTLGTYDGSSEVYLSKQTLPKHSHTAVLSNSPQNSTSGTGYGLTATDKAAQRWDVQIRDDAPTGGVTYHALYGYGVSSENSTGFIQNTGNGMAHANMPPYLALNFIIKYK